MSINEYLKIPHPTPSIQTPPIPQTHTSSQSQAQPQSLTINDQIKMCSMKYKITKNIAEMFHSKNIGISPFRNMLVLHFLCLLIEKYKNDADHMLLSRLHGIMDASFRTNTISIHAMDECVYLFNNPRVVESLYLFTQ
jgi:hypothetical protein